MEHLLSRSWHQGWKDNQHGACKYDRLPGGGPLIDYETGQGTGNRNSSSIDCVLTMHWEVHRGHRTPPASVATNSSPSSARRIMRTHEAARHPPIGSSGVVVIWRRSACPASSKSIILPLKTLCQLGQTHPQDASEWWLPSLHESTTPRRHRL